MISGSSLSPNVLLPSTNPFSFYGVTSEIFAFHISPYLSAIELVSFLFLSKNNLCLLKEPTILNRLIISSEVSYRKKYQIIRIALASNFPVSNLRIKCEKGEQIPPFLEILKQVTTFANPKEIHMDVESILEKEFEAVMEICKKTSSLRIQSCENFSSKGFAAIREHLTSLKLNFANISDDEFIAITESCDKVSSLDLIACKKLTTKGFAAIQNWKELTSIHFNLVNILDDEFISIAKNGKLKFLSLSQCAKLTSKAFATISDCKELTSLDLTNATISNENVNAIMENCKNLSYIGFVWCTNLTSNGIVAATQNPHQLTSIGLTGIGISDDSLNRIMENCKNLHSLNISYCTNLTSNGIVTAIQNRNKLTSIDLAGTSITDSALLEIAKNCENLNSLNLSNCKYVTPDGIIAATSHLKLLVPLKLSNLKKEDVSNKEDPRNITVNFNPIYRN